MKKNYKQSLLKLSLSLSVLSALNFDLNKASAEPIFAVTNDNKLISFDSETPRKIFGNTAILGLQPNEQIVGIDFRPGNEKLYAVSNTSRLYTIDTNTSQATVVGSAPFTPALAGNRFGIDFNPVVDRLRIVSDTGQNLRINPDTGAVVGTDPSLTYATNDANETATPSIVSVAYTNNFTGTTSTSLLGIDFTLNTVTVQGSFGGTPTSANTGILTTVGSLGLDNSVNTGFDISSLSGNTFVSAQRANTGIANPPQELYELNLGSALIVNRLGNIGIQTTITDIAIPISDVDIPVLNITDPTSTSGKITVKNISRSSVTIKGTASDNIQLKSIKYRIIEGKSVSRDKVATGTTSWSISLKNLDKGKTTLEIFAVDIYGNESDVSSVLINRKR